MSKEDGRKTMKVQVIHTMVTTHTHTHTIGHSEHSNRTRVCNKRTGPTSSSVFFEFWVGSNCLSDRPWQQVEQAYTRICVCVCVCVERGEMRSDQMNEALESKLDYTERSRLQKRSRSSPEMAAIRAQWLGNETACSNVLFRLVSHAAQRRSNITNRFERVCN